MSRPLSTVVLLLLATALTASASSPAWSADGFESAITEKDIDLTNSYVLRNGKRVNDGLQQLVSTLGLGARPQQTRPLSGGAVKENEDAVEFKYVIAFKEPVKLGSLLLSGTPNGALVLKSDAKLPADPARTSDWLPLVFPPRQSGARLATLPKVTKTHAIMITDRRESGPSLVYLLRLFSERLHNITPQGLAYASGEYLPPNTVIPFAASRIVRGEGEWTNTGKDGEGQLSSPQITEFNQAWFMLAWAKSQTLSGIWMQDNFQELELDVYTGGDEVNPRVGLDSDWRRLRKYDETNYGGRWISFPPVDTRAIRIRILKATPAPVATISGLVAVTPLGTAPAPISEDPAGQRANSSKQIPLSIDAPRQATLVVNRADGSRVRNLFARESLAAGAHPTGWNLKDESGSLVPPGKYQWEAITWEPFKLRYQTTVYPNVLMHAPENSPWLNGHHGSGGWLADHTPPVGGCVAGDRVFLSAYVAESGVSLIECDLQGHKRWGYHSFAAWTGPRYLASNGRTLFVGSQILNTTEDAIWTIDVESKEVNKLLSLVPQANRRRGMQGIAAHGDQLALSVQANEDWLANATTSDEIDYSASAPRYGAKRKPRKAYDLIPDKQTDFARLFRLIPNPPGGETKFTLQYLEAMASSAPAQHIVIAFKHPVPLGSIVYPVPQTDVFQTRLSVLKPQGDWPPNPDKSSDWIAFDEHGRERWDILPAPPNTVTRAVRISFLKGTAADEEPLAGLLEGKENTAADSVEPEDVEEDDAEAKSLLGGDVEGRWQARLEGMKLLRRRFDTPVATAKIRTSSGTINDQGEWDAERTEALSESNPAYYMLEWETPQALRGMAIKEIDAQFTKIDVYTGTADEIPLAGSQGWKEVATYEQGRRDVGNGYGGLGLMNPTSLYVDGYVDFRQEYKTRAVRLRIVKQWADNGQAACLGVRRDRGDRKLDAKRCHVYGVAPLHYIGGEAAIDNAANDRIEIYSAAKGALEKEISVPKPYEIAFRHDGALFVLSERKVVEVNLSKGTASTVVEDLGEPTDLALDGDGRLYVFDKQPDRQNVRVYSPQGKYERSIGTPGGFKPGPWDPTRMGDVTAIDVDKTGQLWVVETQYYPKRVTVWSTDGEFKKELLGNTPYGGGGVLDRDEPSRILYGTLEFELDWKSGRSRLKNLTMMPSIPPGEIPIRVDGRMYVVNRPQFSEMPVGVVYLYDKDRLKPAAAVGLAVDFEPLKRPDVLDRLGNPNLTKRCFIWTDHSADGEVQPEEVELFDRPDYANGLTLFNDDLGIQQQAMRYTVKEFLPSGVPVYQREELPELKFRTVYKLDNGSFYRMGGWAHEPEAAFSADGKTLWTYPQEGYGVQALTTARPYFPGQVVSQFGIVGHATAHAGDLGEFVVLHNNVGAWNIFTADGLLLGPLFADLRTAGAKSWTSTDHQRGLALENTSAGQEHFAGYFCRTKDDKYYVVAGHNHISVVEVLGLDQVRRIRGELTVTEDDVEQARRYDQQRQQDELYARAPVIDCYRLERSPEIDGKLGDWQAVDSSMGGCALSLGYDENYLYLMYNTRGLGPLKNSGEQFDRLFKTGAAVDLMLGLDPSADANREAPVAGDVRLLLTMVNKKPKAVLFRAVVPGAKPEDQVRIVSPVAEVDFDEVRLLRSVQIATVGDDTGYTLEAAVPLASLGLKPEAGLRLKCDWGVLVSDENGNQVNQRLYWANKSTSIVADAPSEARLHPNLWGHIRFHDLRPSAETQLNDFEVAGGNAGRKGDKKDVDDILGDLQEGTPAKKAAPKK